MELCSVAYNPTPAPGMGGMMQGMPNMQPGMQGMPNMQHGMHHGMPGMQQEMCGMPGMPGMPGMQQEMCGMPGMPGMQQEMCGMPGMQQEMPGAQCMQPEMQGMPEMERMLHGMHRTPGAYPHPGFDPCCPTPCPPCEEPMMPQHCSMPIPTTVPAPTPAHEVYVVKKGDSVYKIAKRYGTTMQAIILGNDLRDPDRIYPGQILFIPEVSTSEYYG